MTNFLNRLAARALGTAPLAQPIVPAVFTPAAPVETGIQIETQPSAWPVVETSTESSPIAMPQKRSATPAVSPESHSAEITGTDVSQTPLEMPAASLFPVRTLISDSEISQVRVSHEPPDFIRQQPQFDAVEGMQARAVEASQGVTPQTAQITQTKPIAVVAQHRQDSFMPMAAFAAPAMAPAQHKTSLNSTPQQPVIKVTIGRVDVRAEFPPASSPAPAARRQSNGMSLEEYARQRSEGKR
jgi:hypothetical protein